MKAPPDMKTGPTKHSVDGIPQGRRSQEASNEVATEFKDVGMPAQPCKRHRSTAAHNSATVQETQQHKKNDRS